MALLLILIFLFLASIYLYNRLVSLKNQALEALADIDVQLKRRYNLIPNLVETVKGYASHEKEVFERVVKARTKALEAKTFKEKEEAENFLSQSLKTIFALSENYPQLRASENFQKLQDELTDTEDKIQSARRFYNSCVRDLNIALESFPTNLFAKIFNFQKMELFSIAQPEEKETPEVKF
ncbi:MAG: LemA family protein [Minisyncoccales bacterium]